MADEIRIEDLTEKTSMPALDDQVINHEYQSPGVYLTKKMTDKNQKKFTAKYIRVENVDLLTVADTLVMAAHTGTKVIAERPYIVYKTVTGVAVIDPVISCGGNSPNYNDVGGNTTVTGPVVEEIDRMAAVGGKQKVIDIGSTGIYVRVSTAGTGYSALTADIIVPILVYS